MRKLASVQAVSKIEPIEGADRIEIAHVKGWQCVVKKGEFEEGDLGVYFEIDSFLPIREEFEFLRNSSYKKSDLMGEGFRLRTQKFRGQISQGLLLPISILRNYNLENSPILDEDVSEILGVRKWEIEERASTDGTIIGELPYDVPHTEEVMVQNFPNYREEFAGLEYYITTKMDGSSHSISLDEDGFHVTGHNYEYSDGSFYDFVRKNGYEEKMRAYAEKHELKTFTIQGEFCAPGIQKNRLKLSEPEWFVFTVRINGKRVRHGQLLQVCWALGLKHVPTEETGYDLARRYPTVESLLARAEGEYPNGGKKEGIVIRPTEPVFSKSLNAELSMKVLNNNYLLKYE